MPPIIPIEKLEHGRKIADTCVHFGFCTAVCPTYVLNGEENDSPRGRIALIKEMLSAKGRPTATAIKHIDRCLSCLSCATTCAAGVDYRPLIDTAREYIEASGARPLLDNLKRKALSYVMTTPRLLRLSTYMARALKGRSGSLPGLPGTLGRLSNARAIKAFAKRDEHIPAALPPQDRPLRKVALLEGCVQSVLGQEINDCARRLLARMGIEVVRTKVENHCCGALDLHLGYHDKALRHAARLVDAWHALLESGEIDSVVATTSGCGSVIRHYRDLFQADPLRCERAARIEAACLDITELLLDCGQSLPLQRIAARVAYHDSCSLKHGQKIVSEPRALLKHAGFVVMDIAESHLCCGSAGTYNILQPEIAARLGQRKADNISATRPDIIAAGNMGCLVQISLYSDTPVAHVLQLVDWAAGGPPPRGMESFTAAGQPSAAGPDTLMWSDEKAATHETSDLLW